jgi:hypothetical protein
MDRHNKYPDRFDHELTMDRNSNLIMDRHNEYPD